MAGRKRKRRRGGGFGVFLLVILTVAVVGLAGVMLYAIIDYDAAGSSMPFRFISKLIESPKATTVADNISDAILSGISKTGLSGVDTDPEFSEDESTENYTLDLGNSIEKAEPVADTPEEVGKYSYFYSRLNDEEKLTYREILSILRNYQDLREITSHDKELISKVFQCVMNDHPEIFYVTGYSCTKYMKGDEIRKIGFSPDYIVDEASAKKRQSLIEDYVNQCLDIMSSCPDEYGKVKKAYEIVVLNTEYDMDAPENQNICSVMLQGRSVCQGYAKTLQYILQRADICAILVLGYDDSGESHAWNEVRIDDEWYHVDVTWGDASYRVNSSDTFLDTPLPEVNYDYLNVTENEICKTHVINSILEVPKATSMDANYYVREGYYVTDTSSESLYRMFDKAYAEGKEVLCLKCSEQGIFNTLHEQLIVDQQIFNYIRSKNSTITYVEQEGTLSFYFWL